MTTTNYQPACKSPQSGCISNAAGYTMCVNCPSDPVLGPVWHKSEAFLPDSKLKLAGEVNWERRIDTKQDE